MATMMQENTRQLTRHPRPLVAVCRWVVLVFLLGVTSFGPLHVWIEHPVRERAGCHSGLCTHHRGSPSPELILPGGHASPTDSCPICLHLLGPCTSLVAGTPIHHQGWHTTMGTPGTAPRWISEPDVWLPPAVGPPTFAG